MSAVVDTTVTAPAPGRSDHRGSWLPNGAMISTRILELRKRRGLMIALAVVNIGIPTLFLTIRLISHAVAPKSYAPAGGYDIFTNLVTGVMFIFGFIVAATMGATAATGDVADGMFRHLVVTGRSRLAIYFARIPAGLAIVVTMVAAGFTIVCAVCCFAAPTKLDYQGVSNVPYGLSQPAFERWAVAHPGEVICGFPSRGPISVNVNCGNGPGGPRVIITKIPSGGGAPPTASKAQQQAVAFKIAKQNYAVYHDTFLSPPNSLMIKAGLWIELEAIIGFTVGLGLASLIGQRTVTIITLIVFEIILTPLLATHVIPHIINLQRGLVGLATAHIEPGALPQVFGHNGPGSTSLVPETTTVAVIVIVAWLVGWTALGAWRMVRRDA